MVTEMWGTVDGTEVTFEEVNGQWVCVVPADFEDGMYIIELWIKTSADEIIYTTAIVYLCDSKCVYFELQDDDITVTIQDDIDARVVVDYEHSIYQGREEICSNFIIEQEKTTYHSDRCDIHID